MKEKPIDKPACWNIRCGSVRCFRVKYSGQVSGEKLVVSLELAGENPESLRPRNLNKQFRKLSVCWRDEAGGGRGGSGARRLLREISGTGWWWTNFVGNTVIPWNSWQVGTYIATNLYQVFNWEVFTKLLVSFQKLFN